MQLGPNYERPQGRIAAAWRIDYAEAAEVANTQVVGAVRRSGAQPARSRTALRGNLDVKRAAARGRPASSARCRTTRSQFFRSSATGSTRAATARAEGGKSRSDPESIRTIRSTRARSLRDWQIDLFGRVRRQSEQAQARGLRERAGPARRDPVACLHHRRRLRRRCARSIASSRSRAKRRRTTADAAALRAALQGRGGLRGGDGAGRVAVPAGACRDPGARASIAQQENLISILVGRNPGPIARGKSLDELAPPAIRPGCRRSCSSAGPTSCRRSRTWSPPTPTSALRRRSTSRSFSITGAFGSVSTAVSDFLTGPSQAGRSRRRCGADLHLRRDRGPGALG